MTTAAPFGARRLGIAAPMPREPPVMSAIFPSSFLDIVFFLFLNLALLQTQPRMWAMPFGLAVFGVEDPRPGGRNRLTCFPSLSSKRAVMLLADLVPGASNP